MGEFDFRPMMNKLVKTGKMWKLVVIIGPLDRYIKFMGLIESCMRVTAS